MHKFDVLPQLMFFISRKSTLSSLRFHTLFKTFLGLNQRMLLWYSASEYSHSISSSKLLNCMTEHPGSEK